VSVTVLYWLILAFHTAGQVDARYVGDDPEVMKALACGEIEGKQDLSGKVMRSYPSSVTSDFLSLTLASEGTSK
jgi:hypothetical protein